MLSEADQAEYWEGWCDGSSVPNPGKMGIGGLLRGQDAQEHSFSQALGRSGCNNEAEACALLALLTLARDKGIARLRVWSDSDVVVRLSMDADQTEAQRLAPLFAKIRTLMALFDEVRIGWLPQHRNMHADRLCRLALGLAERPVVSKTRRKRRR